MAPSAASLSVCRESLDVLSSDRENPNLKSLVVESRILEGQCALDLRYLLLGIFGTLAILIPCGPKTMQSDYLSYSKSIYWVEKVATSNVT